MNRRCFVAGLAAAGASLLLAGHTPYRQWKLYRQTHLLIFTTRDDPGSDEARIHAMWSEELGTLLDTYDTRPNLAYYVPYFRSDNCSHCVSIPPIDHDLTTVLNDPWLGTEIEAEQVTLRDFVELLLDDARPLRSYREDPQPDEQFTPEQSAKCMMP